MLKYYVRTTGERKLDSSFDQIEYSFLLDREKKITQIFGDQLLSISDNDCVLLEDDIVLCHNFKDRIESIIKEHLTTIINFFTEPFYLMKPGFTNNFYYNQCTYYPSSTLKFLGTEIKKNQQEKGFLETPEKAIKRVFKEYNLTCYNYTPYLVQHLDYESKIGHDGMVGMRRSPFFIDYLDDLGMSLEDAFMLNNQSKLKKYMRQWFEKREKESGLVI